MRIEDYKNELALEDREYGIRQYFGELRTRSEAKHRNKLILKQMRQEDSPKNIKNAWEDHSGHKAAKKLIDDKISKARFKNGAIGGAAGLALGGAAGAGIASLGNSKRSAEIDELEGKRNQSDQDRIRIAKLKATNKRRNLIGTAIGATAGVAIGAGVGSRFIGKKNKDDRKSQRRDAKRAKAIYKDKYEGK